VAVGEELPAVVRGPLSLQDVSAFLVGTGRSSAHGVLLREAMRHPDHFFRNPESGGGLEYTGIGHLRDSVAEAVGVPGAYDYGPQRVSWLGTLMTNWMGDHGFLKRLKVQVARPGLYGDLTTYSGRLTARDEDTRTVTLEITVWSTLFALLLGLGAALLRLSDSMAGRFLARFYLETVRNTPLLIQIYLFYFVLGPILGLDRFAVGVAALAVFEGAFACEVIRAGILSVARGQWEASDSIGLDRVQGYRYVILPQAVPLMLPPLTGLIISLIKNSAIVSVIAVFDLTTEGRNIIADTFLSFEIWMTVAAIYLVLTVTLSVFVSYLEHRVRARE